MPESTTSQTIEAYAAAVDQLVRGRAGDALPLLESLASRGKTPQLSFALGKCYLELRRGAEALDCFRIVLDSTSPTDAAFRAYVRLLAAYAAALSGDRAGAETALDEIARADPRLESTARSLRRQIQSGHTLLLRL